MDINELNAKYGKPAVSVATSSSAQAPSPLAQAWAKKSEVPQDTNLLSKAKSFVGGVAEGAAGAALTAEDWAGRKLVNKFGTEQMKQNIANAPSLHEQFGNMMGKKENPNIYGAGQLTGEIASLAAPVGFAGKAVTKGVGIATKGLEEASNIAKGASAVAKGTKGLQNAGTMGNVLGGAVKVIKGAGKLAQAGVEGVTFTAGQGLQEGKMPTSEDYKTNALINAAFPAAGMAMRAGLKNASARLVNSLIKPLSKDFTYGKDPGKAVAEMGITANNWEDLINKINVTRNQVGQKIGEVVRQSPGLQALKGESLSSILDPINEAISKAGKSPRTNATLIQRLENVKGDLADRIAAGDNAHDIKGTIGDLTKWTTEHTDDTTVNGALTRAYGKSNQLIDNVLSKELSPEAFQAFKKSNEQYGGLITAENAAIYRDKVIRRHDIVSFGAKNAGFLAGLTATLATGGAGLPALVAAMAGAGVDKAAATPAFKTRLAKVIQAFTPEEAKTIFDTVPAIKTIFTPDEIKKYFKSFEPDQWNRGRIDFNAEIFPKKQPRDAVGKFAEKSNEIPGLMSASEEKEFQRIKDILSSNKPSSEKAVLIEDTPLLKRYGFTGVINATNLPRIEDFMKGLKKEHVSERAKNAAKNLAKVEAEKNTGFAKKVNERFK